MTIRSIFDFILVIAVCFSVYFLVAPPAAQSPIPNDDEISYYADRPDRPIIELTAFPAHVVAGQPSKVIWNVRGAESCISGSNDIVPQEWITPSFKGSMSITTKNTTTLTLICTGPGGVAIAKVDVKIGNVTIAQTPRPVIMFRTPTDVSRLMNTIILATMSSANTIAQNALPTNTALPPTIPAPTLPVPTVPNPTIPQVPQSTTLTVPDPDPVPATAPASPQPLRHTGPIPWKSSAFNSANPIGISFSPRASWMIFLRSSPPMITATDGSSITVYDIDGKEVYSGVSGQTLPTLQVGHYFVESATDRSQFFIMPDDYTSTSFLGSNLPARSGSSGFAMPGQSFRSSKFSWGRNFAAGSWDLIQTTQDTWDWTEADARMVAAQDTNQILAINGNPPAWVTDEELLDRFASFASTVVSRYTSQYPGKIKYIEILNEPWCCGVINNSFFDYLPYAQISTTYAELTQKVATAVKAIDPSLLVVGPAMQVANLADFQNLASAGINQYIDGISWHEYRLGMYWPDEIDSNNTRVDTQLETIRSIFPGKKLIIDEIGFTGLSALGSTYAGGVSGCGEYGLSYGNWRTDPWHVGMNKITKLIIMLRGGGVDTISTHIFNLYNPNCAWAGWETGNPDPRGIKPQSSAYLMTGYWLNNVDFVQKKVLNGDKIFLYAWRRSNGEAMIFAWTVKNQTVRLSSIQNALFTDIFGNPASSIELTEQPTIIRSSSVTPSDLLSAIESAL